MQSVEQFGTTKFYLNATDFVQSYVFERVFGTPAVDVDRQQFGSTTHGSQNCEYSSTTTHIKHFFVGQIHFQNFSDHQTCCFVMPGAKRHFRIDNNVIFSHRNILVKRTVNYTFFANHNGFKVMLFPFLVPVFRGYSYNFV